MSTGGSVKSLPLDVDALPMARRRDDESRSVELIVESDDGFLLFAGIGGVYAQLEGTDVENNVYPQAFDRLGRRWRMKTPPPVKPPPRTWFGKLFEDQARFEISRVEPIVVDVPALRDLIIRNLPSADQDAAEALSLDELLELALARRELY